MRKNILVVMTAILVLALATAAMAADAFVGTWKLNVAKTKVNPGPTAKSVTMKVVPEGDGFKWTKDFVTDDGQAFHMEWSGKYDGKDYPVTGDPNADTNALKKSDSNSFVEVDKKAGKVVGNWRSVISKDGKTMTSTGKYKDAKGQDFTVTAVFNKQ